MLFEDLVIATKNHGKFSEFQRMLQGVAKVVRMVPDDFVMPEETGDTFEDNAYAKARAVSLALGVPALADDSGLMVDALQGAPGVYSARFGGEGLDDAGRTRLLLARLAHVPWEARTAKFVAALALVRPDGEIWQTVGECPGMILLAPSGEQGFGYDPVFYYPPLERAFAQLNVEEKNQISHRTRALQQLMRQLS